MSQERRVKIRFAAGTDMQAAEAVIASLPGTDIKTVNEGRHLISVRLGLDGPTLEALRAIPGVLTAEYEEQFVPDLAIPRTRIYDPFDD